MYKVSYFGDGQTLEFIFVFPFFQESDIRVALNEEVLDSSQYSVNMNPEFDGGTVMFAVPPIEGTKIDIFRQISLERTIDYQPTVKIDPENLNTDFNFILEAFKDFKSIDVDLAEWKNIHDNLVSSIEYTISLIEDKLSGGGVLGLYNNLLSVLAGALPNLINDYGSITEIANNENADDYGIL